MTSCTRPFPLFHLDAAVLTVVPALVLGTTAAIGQRFSVSGFWDDVRAFGATVFDFMGATLTMLHKSEPGPTMRTTRPDWRGAFRCPSSRAEFEQRFGLRLVELYGSTDAGVPIYQPLDEPRRPGLVRARDRRLRRAGSSTSTTCQVAPGEVGEIVVRPREPSLISDGYHGMPEATADVAAQPVVPHRRSGPRDDDGYFYFVGRRTDSIRRRGENISAFEVEEVVKLHPASARRRGVRGAQRAQRGGRDGRRRRRGRDAAIDPAELVGFCRERMARHMVPRYIDVVDALPRTPTEKVEKHRLQERGVTATTWDRDAEPQER